MVRLLKRSDTMSGNSGFETYEQIPDETQSKVDHIKVSAKMADGDLSAIAIQPFIDETTPHGQMGVQLEPGALDDLIDAMEFIRMEHLME